MRKQNKWYNQILKVISILSILLIFSFCENGTETVHDLKITESDDGKWHVFNEADIRKDTLFVERSDLIQWRAVSSDMTFFFPVDMETYFEFEDGKFSETRNSFSQDRTNALNNMEIPAQGVSVARIQESESLYLKVLADAPLGAIDYNVYVEEAEQLVVGNSPPILVIQESQ